MSNLGITKILSNPDNWQLREKLIKEFPIPEYNLKGELKAPPLTTNYSKVGTAFDYIFCRHIKVLNQNNCESRFSRFRIHDFCVLVDYVINYPIDVIPLNSKRSSLSQSLGTSNLELNNRKEILTTSLVLEKIERFYNIFPSLVQKHDINDVKDIIALHSLIDNQLFVTEKKCYLYPYFGGASNTVGATADLVIGNTLIDVKTTITLEIDRVYFNQIICYYVLSLIGGINKYSEEKPIKNIGIYFARHGILWKIPISQLGDSQKFESFRKWFVAFLRKRNIADLRRRVNKF